MLEKLESFSDKLNRVCEILVTVFIAVLIIIMSVAVVLRYGFGFTLSWSDALARYMLVWSTFLGAAVAVKADQHIHLTLVQDAFSEKIKNAIILFAYASFLFLCIFLFKSGIDVIKLVLPQKESVMPISMGWPYGAIAVSYGIIIFQLAVKIILFVRENFSNKRISS